MAQVQFSLHSQLLKSGEIGWATSMKLVHHRSWHFSFCSFSFLTFFSLTRLLFSSFSRYRSLVPHSFIDGKMGTLCPVGGEWKYILCQWISPLFLLFLWIELSNFQKCSTLNIWKHNTHKRQCEQLECCSASKGNFSYAPCFDTIIGLIFSIRPVCALFSRKPSGLSPRYFSVHNFSNVYLIRPLLLVELSKVRNNKGIT